ncbi:hypothetical protein [uncultured Psychroserpens sp.]|nr:hypothetical protein [uncultured Psychroserpens sp.]
MQKSGVIYTYFLINLNISSTPFEAIVKKYNPEAKPVVSILSGF